MGRCVIILRNVNNGVLSFVHEGEELDLPVEFDDLEYAQSWIVNSPIVQSGQIITQIVELEV